MDEKERKKQIREIMRKNLTNSAGIQTKSRLILDQIVAEDRYQKAKTLFCYIAKPEEVQTEKIIEAALKENKQVFAPIFCERSKEIIGKLLTHFPEELQPGAFGILEPTGSGQTLTLLESIDLFLIPGLAFDMKGRRLGRGSGAFDRFLSSVDRKKIYGLAFESQIIEGLPCEPHDIYVSKLITEKRSIIN